MFAASPTIAMRCAEFRGRQREVEAARVAIRRGNGVLIAGRPGMGATTLLDHIVGQFGSRQIIRVFADGFEARPGSAESARSIVVADDVDLLDVDLQCRINSLVARRKAIVVAATTLLRCGHAGNQVCWHKAAMRRIWLDVLRDVTALQVIEDLLVGEVDGPTFQSLIELAAGVPRDLIDLLVGSHQVGLITPTVRGWVLTGEPSTHMVRSTSIDRLDTMPQEVRRAARQLAYDLPRPMRMVHAAVGTPVLRALFDADLLIDHVGRDVTVVDFVRPLDAVLLRQR